MIYVNKDAVELQTQRHFLFFAGLILQLFGCVFRLLLVYDRNITNILIYTKKTCEISIFMLQ